MLNNFCPGRGSNQELLPGSLTLYRIAIKAGLYRKAVKVCIIPNITTLTLDASAVLVKEQFDLDTWGLLELQTREYIHKIQHKRLAELKRLSVF